jgi:adenylate kinase
MKNIIIFGPPGIDLSYYTSRVVSEYGLSHVSSDIITRKSIDSNSKLGILSGRILDSGRDLPDEIINEMIKSEVIGGINGVGFIFDDFPRSASQARMIDQLLHYKKVPISKVISISLTNEVSVERFIGGGGNISDFNIKWSGYQSKILPIIGYFGGRGIVDVVDGSLGGDIIYDNIKKIIDGL